MGLTRVDPAAYGGWDGTSGCWGCAADVSNMKNLLEARGWEVTALIDGQATGAAVKQGLERLAAESQAGDSALFYVSAHGGQEANQPDDTDDIEFDGQDETLVCYDGQMRDDVLNDVWLSFRAGVEIFMLSDTCNSGTNYKGLPMVSPVPTPVVPIADRAVIEEMRAKLLHMGGCRDTKTSTGQSLGGVFTLSIVRAIEGGFSGNWEELYARVRSEVSETQDPAINLYPEKNNTLGNRKPFIPRAGSRDGSSGPAASVSQVSSGTLGEGEEMLRRIDRTLAARESATRSAPRGNGVKLVAEGDSWFDFSPLAPDIIDWLKKDYGYDIENLAKAGACVYEMAYGPDDDSMWDVFGRDPSQLEEVVKKIRSHRPQGFLLSGAGNDFAGPEFIMTIHHARARKSGVNQGVIDALFQADLEPAFRLVIETVTAAAQQAGLGTIPIFTHGYDYSFPDGRSAANLIVKKIGPWMHPSFEAKGYPYKNDQDLAVRRELVKVMIDGVYKMHGRLASSYPNLKVVNVRGALPNRGDWHDELHPSKDGFKKVASLFHAEIRKVLGARAVPQPDSRSTFAVGLPGPPDLNGSDGVIRPLVESEAAAEPSKALAGAVLIDALPTVVAVYNRSVQARVSVREILASGRIPETYDALDAAWQAGGDDLDDLAELPGPLAAVENEAWLALESEVAQAFRSVLATGNSRDASRDSATSYEARSSHYQQLFADCKVTSHQSDIAWYVGKMVAGRPRYEALERELNVPWEFIAIIHALECSCNFKQHLHNGDPLADRTKLVPAGRPATGSPPFTWEESARDALTMPGKQFHLQVDWSVPAMIYRFEKYNGFGYLSKGIESPYLWSFSNQYTKGKYVGDGRYDPNAVSKQAGAAVLLKELHRLGHAVSRSAPPKAILVLDGLKKAVKGSGPAPSNGAAKKLARKAPTKVAKNAVKKQAKKAAKKIT